MENNANKHYHHTGLFVPPETTDEYKKYESKDEKFDQLDTNIYKHHVNAFRSLFQEIDVWRNAIQQKEDEINADYQNSANKSSVLFETYRESIGALKKKAKKQQLDLMQLVHNNDIIMQPITSENYRDLVDESNKERHQYVAEQLENIVNMMMSDDNKVGDDPVKKTILDTQKSYQKSIEEEESLLKNKKLIIEKLNEVCSKNRDFSPKTDGETVKKEIYELNKTLHNIAQQYKDHSAQYKTYENGQLREEVDKATASNTCLGLKSDKIAAEIEHKKAIRQMLVMLNSYRNQTISHLINKITQTIYQTMRNMRGYTKATQIQHMQNIENTANEFIEESKRMLEKWQNEMNPLIEEARKKFESIKLLKLNMNKLSWPFITSKSYADEIIQHKLPAHEYGVIKPLEDFIPNACKNEEPKLLFEPKPWQRMVPKMILQSLPDEYESDVPSYRGMASVWSMSTGKSVSAPLSIMKLWYRYLKSNDRVIAKQTRYRGEKPDEFIPLHVLILVHDSKIIEEVISNLIRAIESFEPFNKWTIDDKSKGIYYKKQFSDQINQDTSRVIVLRGGFRILIQCMDEPYMQGKEYKTQFVNNLGLPFHKVYKHIQKVKQLFASTTNKKNNHFRPSLIGYEWGSIAGDETSQNKIYEDENIRKGLNFIANQLCHNILNQTPVHLPYDPDFDHSPLLVFVDEAHLLTDLKRHSKMKQNQKINVYRKNNNKIAWSNAIQQTAYSHYIMEFLKSANKHKTSWNVDKFIEKMKKNNIAQHLNSMLRVVLLTGTPAPTENHPIDLCKLLTLVKTSPFDFKFQPIWYQPIEMFEEILLDIYKLNARKEAIKAAINLINNNNSTYSQLILIFNQKFRIFSQTQQTETKAEEFLAQIQENENQKNKATTEILSYLKQAAQNNDEQFINVFIQKYKSSYLDYFNFFSTKTNLKTDKDKAANFISMLKQDELKKQKYQATNEVKEFIQQKNVYAPDKSFSDFPNKYNLFLQNIKGSNNQIKIQSFYNKLLKEENKIIKNEQKTPLFIEIETKTEEANEQIKYEEVNDYDDNELDDSNEQLEIKDSNLEYYENDNVLSLIDNLKKNDLEKMEQEYIKKTFLDNWNNGGKELWNELYSGIISYVTVENDQSIFPQATDKCPPVIELLNTQQYNALKGKSIYRIDVDQFQNINDNQIYSEQSWYDYKYLPRLIMTPKNANIINNNAKKINKSKLPPIIPIYIPLTKSQTNAYYKNNAYKTDKSNFPTLATYMPDKNDPRPVKKEEMVSPKLLTMMYFIHQLPLDLNDLNKENVVASKHFVTFSKTESEKFIIHAFRLHKNFVKNNKNTTRNLEFPNDIIYKPLKYKTLINFIQNKTSKEFFDIKINNKSNDYEIAEKIAQAFLQFQKTKAQIKNKFYIIYKTKKLNVEAKKKIEEEKQLKTNESDIINKRIQDIIDGKVKNDEKNETDDDSDDEDDNIDEENEVSEEKNDDNNNNGVEEQDNESKDAELNAEKSLYKNESSIETGSLGEALKERLSNSNFKLNLLLDKILLEIANQDDGSVANVFIGNTSDMIGINLFGFSYACVLEMPKKFAELMQTLKRIARICSMYKGGNKKHFENTSDWKLRYFLFLSKFSEQQNTINNIQTYEESLWEKYQEATVTEFLTHALYENAFDCSLYSDYNSTNTQCKNNKWLVKIKEDEAKNDSKLVTFIMKQGNLTYTIGNQLFSKFFEPIFGTYASFYVNNYVSLIDFHIASENGWLTKVPPFQFKIPDTNNFTQRNVKIEKEEEIQLLLALMSSNTALDKNVQNFGNEFKYSLAVLIKNRFEESDLKNRPNELNRLSKLYETTIKYSKERNEFVDKKIDLKQKLRNLPWIKGQTAEEKEKEIWAYINPVAGIKKQNT